MQVQTEDKMFRAVCFSAEKHKEFKARSEAACAVKLTKFRLKQNTWSNEDEIHLTKRTKLEEPKEEETNFDFKVADPTNEDCFPLTAIETIVAKESSTNVSVSGPVTFQQKEETVMMKGKQITKCSECGLVELLSKSTNRMLANALFNNGDEEISLIVLFDDKLQQLHKLFCSQQACKKEFQQCDENEIMLMLLTVSATVVFNKNNNSVVAIKEV
ncbi:Hypothetical predicted protein [Paramuricea clavata]|uniref:Uncharacterized protein n=1 Tax=Paramuricea clavata TaxID=317549 RepID=A0A7D9HDM2_PARCT|nr:Hypothetical predicted protein [Paramuricea clavata]